LVCLSFSLGGPLQAGAGKMQGGTASGATVITMVLMHLAAAAVIVGLLTMQRQVTHGKQEGS